jgi:glutathione S-transferase
MRRLTGIAFSPWSEKAKWALDHHRIEYRYEEYVPLLGELILRARMHMPRGVVTVPVLQVGSTWLLDSLDIAKYADRSGSAKTLFPEDKILEIELWNQRSEAAMSAGRALAVLEAAKDPNTAQALVPPRLRPILGGIAQKGLAAFIDKYRMRHDAEKHAQTLMRELTKLQAALKDRGGYVVGDGFTYADIVMATAVQFVVPVDSRYMPAGPPGVEWTPNDALVARFADLLAWRDALYGDALYEKHRRT